MSVNAAPAIEAALRCRGMPAAFQRGFLESVAAAARGPCHVPEATLGPVTDLPVFPGSAEAASEDERARTVAITLNGGLGTTMGMRAPKALLYATEGMTFLDIALKQAETAGVRPVLMNSFATDAAIREALGDKDVRTFLQHEAPKLRRADFAPVRVPDRPHLEWCPPGHGDLYTAWARAACSPTSSQRVSATPSSRTWTTWEGVPTRRCWRTSSARAPRSSWKPSGAPPRTGRAVTWRAAAATGGWCSGRRRSAPPETRTPSGTTSGTAGSTPTTSGCGSRRSRRRCIGEGASSRFRRSRTRRRRIRAIPDPSWCSTSSRLPEPRSRSSKGRRLSRSRGGGFAPVKTTENLLVLRLGHLRDRRERPGRTRPRTAAGCARPGALPIHQ